MDQATIDRLTEVWLPAGALGAALAIVLPILLGRPAPGDWPVAGALVLGVAAGTDDPPVGIVAGLVAAAIVELVGGRLGDGPAERLGRAAVATTLGLVAAGVDTELLPVLVVAGVIAVAAIGRLDGDRPGRFPLLLVVTIGGIWLTVPDTEEATTLVGGGIVVALLSLRVPLRADAMGTVVGVTAVLVAVGIGGAARDGAVVGATIAIVSLASSPVVDRWTGRRTPFLTVLAVHGAVVVVATRVGGLRTDAGAAAVIGGAALLGGVLALVAVGHLVDRRRVSP